MGATPQLVVDVFNLLVSIYPYHPILWSLYNVTRYLRTQKPTFGKEVKVWDYNLRCKPTAFEGELGDIRDVILYEKGGSGTMAVLGIVEEIPENFQCADLPQTARRFYYWY
jgi:hypothetical protein